MSRIEELKALEKAAKQGGTCDCGNRTGIPKDCKDECNRVRLSASNAYHNAAVAALPALLEIASTVDLYLKEMANPGKDYGMRTARRNDVESALAAFNAIKIGDAK